LNEVTIFNELSGQLLISSQWNIQDGNSNY